MTDLKTVIRYIRKHLDEFKHGYGDNLIFMPTTEAEVLNIFKLGKARGRNFELICKRFGLNGYTQQSYKDMVAEYEIGTKRMNDIVNDITRRGIYKHIQTITNALNVKIKAIITNSCPMGLMDWCVEEDVIIIDVDDTDHLTSNIAIGNTLYILDTVYSLIDFSLTDIIKAGYQLGVFAVNDNNDTAGIILLANGDTITWDLD